MLCNNVPEQGTCILMDTISEAERFTLSVATVLFSALPISNDCYCRSHRKSYVKYRACAHIAVGTWSGGRKVSDRRG